MTEHHPANVTEVSVVLVSPNPIDPQSIRPEALSNAGIVPANWGATGGISTPPVVQTLYQNGFVIQIEGSQGNRCSFQEIIGGALRDTYEVHAIARRYLDATKLVAYEALGVNWSLEVAVENPSIWIREKLLGNAPYFSDFHPTSVEVAKELEFAICNLNFNGENGHIVMACNYHFQLEHSSPDVIISALDSWRQCQEHLTSELLPQL